MNKQQTMTENELLACVDRWQSIQKQHPPRSAEWRIASKHLHRYFRELARRQKAAQL